MAGLQDLLNSEIGQQLIKGASSETGASTSKTSEILNMGLPLLIGAMKKNAQTESGANGLMSALNKKHDGSILDNLGSILGGGVNPEVMQDGEGILGHVLGQKQPVVENALSEKSGLDAGSIGKILKIAAPVLLGLLGKQTQQNKVDGQQGLNGILGSMLGGQPQENQSMIASLIDRDGDGSVLDDVADMVLGSKGKNDNGLGGMIGGFFGK